MEITNEFLSTTVYQSPGRRVYRRAAAVDYRHGDLYALVAVILSAFQAGWKASFVICFPSLRPCFLGLARLLGTDAPRLGLLTAVTGLGIGFGILPSIARIIQAGLANAGYDIAIFSLDAPGMPILLLLSGVGTPPPIVLGIG